MHSPQVEGLGLVFLNDPGEHEILIKIVIRSTRVGVNRHEILEVRNLAFFPHLCEFALSEFILSVLYDLERFRGLAFLDLIEKLVSLLLIEKVEKVGDSLCKQLNGYLLQQEASTEHLLKSCQVDLDHDLVL